MELKNVTLWQAAADRFGQLVDAAPSPEHVPFADCLRRFYDALDTLCHPGNVSARVTGELLALVTHAFEAGRTLEALQHELKPQG